MELFIGMFFFSLAEVKAIAEHGGEWSAQQFGLPWGWWEQTKRRPKDVMF